METSLFEALVQYIGTNSPKAIAEALGNIGKWGATEADYISFLSSKGYTILEGTEGQYLVYKAGEFFGGNGNAASVSSVFEAAGTETTIGGTNVTQVTATGTGTGLMNVGVESAGKAIAPALGLNAAFTGSLITYDLWDRISNRLNTAGKLNNGKVNALLDENGKTYFDEETIEIFKNAFLEAGLFDAKGTEVDDEIAADLNVETPVRYSKATSGTALEHGTYINHVRFLDDRPGPLEGDMYLRDTGSGTTQDYRVTCCVLEDQPDTKHFIIASNTEQEDVYLKSWSPQFDGFFGTYTGLSAYRHDDETVYYGSIRFTEQSYETFGPLVRLTANQQSNSVFNRIAWLMFYGLVDNPALQPGATTPTEDPFPETFTDWLAEIFNGKDWFPTSMPKDDNTQAPSQTGDNDSQEQADFITDNVLNPDPIPTPTPKPDPDPQPEPQPDPQPEPAPTPVPDPSDPNEDPEPSDPSPILPVISGVSASHMVTVYNPTDAQVNALGAFLWVDNVIEQIRLIFQDPMDGIISLHKIYAQPVTGTMKDIYLGYMDSGVDALEVTNQFTTVNCGKVDVDELRENATDYPPYTQAHIYLPFIGIEELDVSEIMGGELRVQYRVDAYTGTCVAQIFVKRYPDMQSEQMIYTYSGNASQTIPLTSSNFTGLVSSLVSIAGGAATAGAGGALLAAGRGLTTHMASVSHSGSISANAGIMGPRKPFLILTRQQGYDANGYSSLYGYPTNRTVYLSNCTGFVRVKDILYRGDATEAEKREIVSLLQEGVII